MNFSQVTNWIIPEGEVLQVKDTNNTRIIWSKGSTPGPDYSEPFWFKHYADYDHSEFTIKKYDSAHHMYATIDDVTFEYSTDKINWYTLGTVTDNNNVTFSIHGSNKYYLRAVCDTLSKSDNGFEFKMIRFIRTQSCRIEIGGNILSLIYGSDFENYHTVRQGEYYSGFAGVFTALSNGYYHVNASKLLLPTQCVVNYEYANFLPYSYELPKLPSLSLTPYCYYKMFRYSHCSAAPELPATTLAEGCYKEMFEDCTSLISAPELPATTLADYCYSSMFIGCTSLTSAPEILPAQTLSNSCYSSMFNGCTSLTSAPEILPAQTLSNSCYNSMFYGCTHLSTAPDLPASILKPYSYYFMFYGCSSLDYVKCLATSGINTNDSTARWLDGVYSSGTFVKAAGVTWPSGAYGIPSKWTVIVQ